MAAVGMLSRDVGDELELIGVSDAHVLDVALTRMFGDRYRNHQFHEEPFLVLCQVRPAQVGTADIVTCSEVLEHVPNPASRAFFGLASLLRPGGIAVLSVPHGTTQPHQEHYPPLREAHTVQDEAGAYHYVGMDESGTARRFTDLVFHGGEGSTLEHRVFNASSFAAELTAAGFSSAYPLLRDHPAFGAAWEPWSRIWLAVKAVR